MFPTAKRGRRLAFLSLIWIALMVKINVNFLNVLRKSKAQSNIQMYVNSSELKAAKETRVGKIDTLDKTLFPSSENIDAYHTRHKIAEQPLEKETKVPDTKLQEDNSSTFRQNDVHWFDSSKMKRSDYFSAAWMMKLSTFLQIPTERMKICEDVVHIVWQTHEAKFRMTEDWMDFAVEHMSKWWKVLDATGRDDDPVSIQRIIGAFQEYTHRNTGPPITDSFHETIAVIPAPSQSLIDTRSPTSQRWSRELSISALRATIASIERLGVGRIVVAGLVDYQDEIDIQEAFDQQRNIMKNSKTKYSHVQMTNETWFNSPYLPPGMFNIPGATLMGIQHAFQGKLSDEETIQWLGYAKDASDTTREASPWKYVYYTEYDTILQTRNSSLQAILDSLEEGMILVPHRLQPIPHYIDLDGTMASHYIRPEGQLGAKTVIGLDREEDSCCDINYHSFDQFEECAGTFWWICGFHEVAHHGTNQDEGLKRYLPYDLIKLNGGTGIVSLAATENGRMCRPQKRSRPGVACKG